jgi:Calcium/calmodulin dependent protein kinase II Association.
MTMMKMLRPLFAIVIAAFAINVNAQSQRSTDDSGREADAAAIRAHIESICQAFVDWDIDKIRATHTDDWRGFLEGSRVPIRGIDEYMRANGIEWPQPPNAPKGQTYPDPKRGFKVFDFDVHFYGPDLAVACFNVDFGAKSGTDIITENRFRIMDVYARRNGKWNQAASHTVIDPGWKEQRMARAGTLLPEARKELLTARESVWRAFFTNNQAQLEKLVPEDTIVLEGPLDKPFIKKADILESARQLAGSGQKLVRLEFPKTEMQVYGNTVIIYTTYLYELENQKGERHTSTGQATEIFVQRDGAWVNPGWHMARAN